MISKTLVLGALGAAVLSTAALSTSASAATTLTFNELRPMAGRTFVTGPFETEGFLLSSSRCSTNNNTCFVTSLNNLNSIDRTGAALVNFMGNATVSLASLDGGLFTLESLVLASNTNNSSGLGRATQDVLFSFSLSNGTTVSQRQTISSTGVANRNLLNFANLGTLSSFSFTPSTGTSGFLQFDDITVSRAVVAAVPEPSAWAMMLLGFGVVGGALRSTRRRLKLSASPA